MELLQLKYFCSAAETENFSKTAKMFVVPVSDISQSIKRLEMEFGCQLFTRTANKVRLNEKGQTFYKYAKAALGALDDGINAIQDRQVSHTIKINIFVNRQVVMRAIEEFQRLYPEVDFIVTHSTSQQISDYDVIVTDEELDTLYRKEEATQEELVLAYNKNFFTFGEIIKADDIEKCSFVTMNEGNRIYEHMQRICNDLGFNPRVALQSEDPFYVRKCIELGLGIAIVPAFSWKGQFADCVEFKRLGNYKRKIYVFLKHGANECLENFNEVLLECFKTTPHNSEIKDTP